MPTVQVVKQDVVKAEVQSTLPARASTQAVAAPLPPPFGATPEALRAAHAAQTLTPGRAKDAMAEDGTPAASPIGPAEEAKSVYTGEAISLNLKDVDLKDFFRLIHEISGLNIILDPNVSGSVTLVLDSIPWDQALDIVLKNERLGKVLEGNVLRIAKIETLTAEQEGQTKLTAARMDAAPLVTVFRPVNYAKAQDIASLLKTWAGGGALSRRGTVLVDARGNTLIISDVQSQIPIIENIISKIDKKAKQVSIEARVVLATADFTRTLAASLLGGYQNSHTVSTGTTGANSVITIPVPTVAQPFPITTATSATASGFGVASVVNVGANYFINAAISAAEERDQAKTISRPSIVTQNNVQGMVQQGVQIPIQTSINNTISVQYENATLQLTVTPQVTDDNNIFLIIMVNNASVGAVVSQAGPSINTQQATTQVLVPDGGTVVFGGITVTGRTKSATYIPLLGNIPILGHLFKTTNATDQDQELLFFVSPKILPG
jgi:type IV pilus assembly protein PilQ